MLWFVVQSVASPRTSADPGPRTPLPGGRVLAQAERALFPLAALGLVVGGLVHLIEPTLAWWAWAATTAGVLLPAAAATARTLTRGETGVDIIAVLAMAGALVLGEALAGAIIAVMLTGGTALERFAVARARRELTALCAGAPRAAHRRRDGAVVSVPVADVVVGDQILVKPGEVVPTDGVLLSASAVLDEAALTGESRPTSVSAGTPVRSGATNAGSPFELRATAAASDSTYAGIVRLVGAAEASKAPLVRLANRYAGRFLLLTLLVAGAAWIASGDPVRALAVLVVATPCPLILAAPAAIIAGVSRAARHGVIIKGGAPLEALARATVLLLDKTGTITSGRPRVVSVERLGALSGDELVRLAASVEQLSVHPLAPAVLAEARDRGLALSFPEGIQEELGRGIEGRVEGQRVTLGQLAWVAPGAARGADVRSVETRIAVEGSSSVFVAVDGRLEGAFILQDRLRPEAPRVLRDLRKAGVARVYMVTGDHPDVADLVGDAVGVDRVFAERAPQEKVEVVELARRDGVTAMVGDGVNDAPALALADVGIAMGARGTTAASEAADIVLTADRLEALALAVRIARRTTRIARGSVFAGMGLSLAAMIAAALGFLPPVGGAVLQEGIDVLVILNALRALGGSGTTRGLRVQGSALARSLSAAHDALRPRIEELADLAGHLDTMAPDERRARLERARVFLVEEVLPHEQEEQRTAYPVLSQLLKLEDPTGPLIRTHQEIHRLVRLFSRLVAQLPAEGLAVEGLRDVRRTLYGLNAVLTLHVAQEEELYSLLDAEGP